MSAPGGAGHGELHQVAHQRNAHGAGPRDFQVKADQEQIETVCADKGCRQGQEDGQQGLARRRALDQGHQPGLDGLHVRVRNGDGMAVDPERRLAACFGHRQQPALGSIDQMHLIVPRERHDHIRDEGRANGEAHQGPGERSSAVCGQGKRDRNQRDRGEFDQGGATLTVFGAGVDGWDRGPGEFIRPCSRQPRFREVLTYHAWPGPVWFALSTSRWAGFGILVHRQRRKRDSEDRRPSIGYRIAASGETSCR